MVTNISRIPVASAMLSAVGYEPISQTLYAEYRNKKRVYAYRGVPAEEYSRLVRAASVGRFMNKRIKGRYPVRRMDDIQPASWYVPA